MKSIKRIYTDYKIVVLFYMGGVFSFILLSLLIHFFWPTFDAQVIGFIRQDRGKGFSALMAFISWWGINTRMIWTVVFVAAMFFINSFRKEALFTLSVFIADGINIILKLLIHRSRPEAIDIYPKFQQGSFPSGHVVHYVVFFGFILTVMLVSQRIPKVLRWVAGALCVFLIGGVSIARIYLGTHWPTDILVAYIIGFMLLSVGILQYLRGRPS
ncbi:MAG: phosphatase PAP2 family protein [Candidatus Omnitrophica bacterium]|nr:phosphatase PAP2 family protein [Candidatus Omnitrophota bacterium]